MGGGQAHTNAPVAQGSTAASTSLQVATNADLGRAQMSPHHSSVQVPKSPAVAAWSPPSLNRTRGAPAAVPTSTGIPSEWGSAAQALAAFYRIYAPERLANVDDIVRTFGSDTHGLNRCLKAKYGATLYDVPPPQKPAPATAQVQPAGKPLGAARALAATFNEPPPSPPPAPSTPPPAARPSSNPQPEPRTPPPAARPILKASPQQRPPERTSPEKPITETTAAPSTMASHSAEHHERVLKYVTVRVEKPQLAAAERVDLSMRMAHIPVQRASPAVPPAQPSSSPQPPPPPQPPAEEEVRLKGVCGCCGHDVMSDQLRTFDGGHYYHQVCPKTCLSAESSKNLSLCQRGRVRV